mgnify:CR=1 FL=1
MKEKRLSIIFVFLILNGLLSAFGTIMSATQGNMDHFHKDCLLMTISFGMAGIMGYLKNIFEALKSK